MNCDPTDYRIGVLGAAGVGKTSLIIQFLGRGFSQNYDPTIDDFFRGRSTIKDLQYLLELLDTSGHEVYASLQDDRIRQSDGVVLVYDVTSRDSFESLQLLIEQVIRVKGWAPFPSRLPIMIVGNKIDLQARRVVEAREGHDLAVDNNCMFTETSAKYGKDVDKAFSDVVKVLLSLSSESSDAPSLGSSLGAPLVPWTGFIDGGCCYVM
ncbi:putative small G-protein Ras2 [Xylaria palmicola]|nr:putative small G-protein Ras2 [Xylaria palmicola]